MFKVDICLLRDLFDMYSETGEFASEKKDFGFESK
jgi:hypothetical protein